MVHCIVDSITGTLGKVLNYLYIIKGFFLDGYRAREHMNRERSPALSAWLVRRAADAMSSII